MSRSTGFFLKEAHGTAQASVLERLYAHVSEPFRRLAAVNELEELSDRQLLDIGVDRREIEAIADREIARLRAR
jgi:uncharacterized protein YjiS (DUF1127 family)